MSIMYFLSNYLHGYHSRKTSNAIVVSILTSPPYNKDKDTITMHVGKNLYGRGLPNRFISQIFANTVCLEEDTCSTEDKEIEDEGVDDDEF